MLENANTRTGMFLDFLNSQNSSADKPIIVSKTPILLSLLNLRNMVGGFKRARSEDPAYTPQTYVKRFRGTGGCTRASTRGQPALQQQQPENDNDEDLEPIVEPSSSAPASPKFWSANSRETTPIPIEPLDPGTITPPNQRHSPGLPASGRSILDSPKKKHRGRPRGSARTGGRQRNPVGQQSIQPMALWPDDEARQQAAGGAHMMAEKWQAVQAEAATQKEVQDAKDRDTAHHVFKLLTVPAESGGFGFKSMTYFVDSLLMRKGDPQVAANLTRFFRDHGDDLARKMDERSPGCMNEFISEKLSKTLAEEGKAIQAHLARDSKTSVTELLSMFSVEKLTGLLPTLAPSLWEILTTVTGADAEPVTDPKETGKKKNQTRREKGLVRVQFKAILIPSIYPAFFSAS